MQVMGDSLELHPITVMLCLIFWGMLWGIPGMLLAAPITAAFKIFFESMDTTRPLAKMLAGTPSHPAPYPRCENCESDDNTHIFALCCGAHSC